MIVDNASRHISAIPVSNLKGETLADKIMQEYFSRYGICKVLHCDQQSSWIGGVVKALNEKLGIDTRISTAYLHHSIGSAERNIRTLERALKCYIEQYPKTWDKILNYLTFSLNDTPNETTGFSAHDLIYARRLRSPLQVLRDSWTTGGEYDKRIKRNVISYLSELREKLQTASEIAHENAASAQRRWKEQYDRRSTDRVLEPGQKVLVLLPSSSYKMFAKWEGPFIVRKKLDDVNYVIDLGHRLITLHINMLKLFHEPTQLVGVVLTAVEAEEEDESYCPITIEREEGPVDLNIGTHLTPVQRKQMSTAAYLANTATF